MSETVDETIDDAAAEYAKTALAYRHLAEYGDIIEAINFGLRWQKKQVIAEVRAIRDTDDLTVGEALNLFISKWGKDD